MAPWLRWLSLTLAPSDGSFKMAESDLGSGILLYFFAICVPLDKSFILSPMSSFEKMRIIIEFILKKLL